MGREVPIVAQQLAHAWRVHAVLITPTRPGRVRLLVTRADPLTAVNIAPEAADLLTVRPGMLQTGQPWVIDFRVVPHWLNAGATQSGKSNLANAVRHTAAALLKDLRVPPRDAQIILGHAHISTTQQIYTHVDDAARLDAVTRLNRLLGGQE